MGFKIGVVGAGQFSRCFIPLFQMHPFCDEVMLAELIPERLNKVAEKFGIKKTFPSLDAMLKDPEIDAIALFTQRHLHGPQVVEALKHGKHVYSAVPMAKSEDEIGEILNELNRTGLIYMCGETSYYYPSTVLCRDRFKAGLMGSFVYGEAQYYHDMMHGFYDAYRYSGGDEWTKTAGFPPMFYPTHSMSMILSVTGAHAVQVSCLGYSDGHMDEIFRPGNNLWDNPFSNETALLRTSDGGIMRSNEYRRIGFGGKNCVYMSMYGTSGSYEEHAGGAVWSSLKWGSVENLTEKLDCYDAYDLDEEVRSEALQYDFHGKLSAVHHAWRLPEVYEKMNNGHFGSHQFLVDDFMKALRTHKLPPNHAWRSAQFVLPGLYAHKSALQNGETLKIPEIPAPPSAWEMLDPDSFVAYRFD
ncbi:MAG: Gfo/Idh/MocA family oxidoreductase [Clostridia bacterium]|nr:Gfo/Idh/MocA family oxidoreductase [Clostridia bacterium]